MSVVVDRRNQDHSDRYITSRERFIRRNKKAVDKAIDNYISGKDFGDIGEEGIDVSIPKRDLKQPNITHGQGGTNTIVHPGNEDFSTGDQVQRPQGGGGEGSGEGEAGNEGQGEDDFIFHLTQEELLDRIFERLGLPNLENKNSQDSTEFEPRHAGYTKSGTPNRINYRRSKRQQIGRQLVLNGPRKREMIACLEEQLSIYNQDESADINELFSNDGYQKMRLNDKIKLLEETKEAVKDEFSAALNDEQSARIDELDEKIDGIKRKIKAVPTWSEETDLRYRFNDQNPVPSFKAVMICMMDISGSMSEQMKHDAKLFYWLLNKLLVREYGKDKVELRFVVHTTEGKEVDQEEFFGTRENGGTRVSSGLEVVENIMKEFDTEGVNVYVAQTSDGDNFGDDNGNTKHMIDNMLPELQAFFYMETKNNAWGNHDRSDIWNMYQTIKGANEGKFFMGRAKQTSDITRIFIDFFKIEDREDKMSAMPNSSNAAMFAPN